jgi:ElaB/YqjD/DUF883 family membrane-anchored ribosome-binding protein
LVELAIGRPFARGHDLPPASAPLIGEFANAQNYFEVRSLITMDEEILGTSGDVAERGLRYTKDQFEQILEQTEEYVRENPTRSIAYALVAGFILNRLPLGRILGGVTRLAFIAFKPAILAYGATKLYQAAQGADE